MRAGDYERVINYDWPNYLLRRQRYYNLSHENKKALSPFYHKNIFDRK